MAYSVHCACGRCGGAVETRCEDCERKGYVNAGAGIYDYESGLGLVGDAEQVGGGEGWEGNLM